MRVVDVEQAGLASEVGVESKQSGERRVIGHVEQVVDEPDRKLEGLRRRSAGDNAGELPSGVLCAWTQRTDVELKSQRSWCSARLALESASKSTASVRMLEEPGRGRRANGMARGC